MPGNDIDFVSDLNGTGDTTVSVLDGSVSANGGDALELNNQRPAVPQAKQVGDKPAVDPADKPLSIRDQISSALKGEADTPPVASQDGRARNPDGTFAAAAAPAAPVAPAPDQGEGQSPAGAPAVAAPQGIDPQVFQTLPAETQAHLARTMDDLNGRQQRVARLEQVEQLIAPRRDAWALNGMTEGQALNQLFALSDFAGRDPAGFIKYMAENSGVDLEELVATHEPVDPQFAALQREIAELRGERTRETQERLQNAHNETVNGVVAFASEKGQDGKPLRPYFDELGSEVLPFISAVKAQNPNMPHNQVLQEAYDRACWGSPAVRAKMQAAANAAGDAERLRAGVDKVDRARSASVSVKSGAPTSAPLAPDDKSRTLRDTIRASMAAAAE
jgi:hypothetical protein